jgi:UDP-3-O-[3-hydroxymyristoyl] N-acetylglucosamine deacetylase
MPLQRTVAKKLKCSGIGLHTGKKIDLAIRPANADTGILFIRTDIESRPEIRAISENVIETNHATTIGKNGHKVSTVEHLLAAFAGLRIDNAIVELNASEVPIMDGSAAPFIHLLKTAGVQNLSAEREYIRIKKPIKVQDGDKKAYLLPSKEFKIHYSIEFDNPVISEQTYKVKYSVKNFEKEIANARTFGFLHEVNMLKKQGLARGGTLDNAIVLDKYRVLNPDGLRYEDEFVRHKVLDAIGDLSLIGKPIIGYFLADKSGHALNHDLVQKVLKEKDRFEVVKFKSKEEKKSFVPKPKRRLSLATG